MSDEPSDAIEPALPPPQAADAPSHHAPVEPVEPAEPVEPVDLSGAERDLAAVEAALQRLDAGTYWTDEVTGEPIADHVLEADPLARRNPAP